MRGITSSRFKLEKTSRFGGCLATRKWKRKWKVNIKFSFPLVENDKK